MKDPNFAKNQQGTVVTDSKIVETTDDFVDLPFSEELTEEQRAQILAEITYSPSVGDFTELLSSEQLTIEQCDQIWKEIENSRLLTMVESSEQISAEITNRRLPAINSNYNDARFFSSPDPMNEERRPLTGILNLTDDLNLASFPDVPSAEEDMSSAPPSILHL